MPRILLQQEHLNLDVSAKQETKTGFVSDRDILKKRSKKYMDAIASLDQESLTATKGMEELMKAVQEEFGTAELTSLPLGIVSKCWLGHPFEVHTLDLSGTQIIRHYKIAEPMDAAFEAARTVALHNAYAMVEVYKDKLILIRKDGSATKL